MTPQVNKPLLTISKYGIFRIGMVSCGLIVIWQAIVWITKVPNYILPPPSHVMIALWENHQLLLYHGKYTTLEIILGALCGISLGTSTALIMVVWRTSEKWILPLLIISQTLPVFAIAPILVTWLGFGISSKISVTTLIVFFPVTVAIYTSLKTTPSALVDQVKIMTGNPPLKDWRGLFYVIFPAGLPPIGAGVKTAITVAPIGAIVGEWVGSSAGLGYLILMSNARSHTSLMFAAVFTLSIIALMLYGIVNSTFLRLTSNHTL